MKRTGMAVALALCITVVAGAAAVAAEPTQALWGKPVAWAAKTQQQFFAAPDGKAGNPGTKDSPWDLASAVSGANAAKIGPGSVLWLRGGTYKGCFHCTLKGTAEAPIIVRAFPGERATLDCPEATADGSSCFYATGQYVTYWGFELVQTEKDLAKRCKGGVEPKGGKGQDYVNLVIHDVGNSSLGGPNLLYGCIFYNIGLDDPRDQLHPTYPQNNDLQNVNRIVDNIIFNSSFGIHAYATQGYIRGFVIEGNVLFDNYKDNMILGSKTNPIEGIIFKDNMGWVPKPTDRSLALGRYDKAPKDITLTGNYLKGATQFSNKWASVKMEGNTFYPAPTPPTNIDVAQFPNNTYLTEAPKEAKVFVRPNLYEPKRANIAVYNWLQQDTVSVDLKGVLEPGDKFEVRNAQNPFAKPVVTGTYDGKAVALPMTGLNPFPPIAPAEGRGTQPTGKEFNVFLVLGGPSILGAGVGQ